MLFNATFNNISVKSWRSVLLVEETGVPGENHLPQGRIQDFKLGGGGGEIFGVFHVKNHDFTPKKKSYFYQF